MVPATGQLALLALGFLLAVCQALENSTSPLSDSPVAAAVVSHFNKCPDSHTQYCFHGTCRFLVQEEKPACVCHSGYVGVRCEHADLLAVVAASQKKQAITALVVVSIVALAVLIITCVLIHCCQLRKHCEWCRALVCRHEKPSALLKGRTACCHSETGTGGLKIPEEEFSQVACDSPTKERCLGTTPPAVPRPLGHAGRPFPSVHNHLGSLLSFESLQNHVMKLPAGLSQCTPEKASEPRFKDKLNKNLKGLAFLLTHTKNEFGLLSPTSHGFQTVSSPWAI